MSVLFTDVITVYNHYRDPETEEESWIPTVIRGVQWSHNKKEVIVTDGVQTESKAERITIDFGRSYGNKPYLEPSLYRKLDNESRKEHWTLDCLELLDVVVLGVSDKEIVGGYRVSDLRRDFQYVGTVKSVSDNRNRSRLKHIKVVAV